MPIDPVSYRNITGKCEQQRARNDTPDKIQKHLNQISASQQCHQPRQCDALTLLYFSGLVLPVLQQVCVASPDTKSSALISNMDRKTTRNINILQVLPHKILTISSKAPAIDATRPPKVSFSPRSRGTIARKLPRCKPEKSSHQSSDADTPQRLTWFSLPMASATESSPLDHLHHDGDNNLVYAEGDNGKNLIINLSKTFLKKVSEIDETELNDFELNARLASAHGPIVISHFNMQLPFQREKRISFREHEKNIAEHIKHHCAFETEIFNAAEESQGRVYIFVAQSFDNPFKLLFTNPNNGQHQTAEHIISEISNFSLDVISMGIKPVLGGLLADFFRYLYFANIDDRICMRRQVHLAIAQLGTGLSVSNLRYSLAKKPHRPPAVQVNSRSSATNKQTNHANEASPTSSETHLPLELKNAVSTEIRATFIAHNQETNTKIALLQTAKPHGSSNVDETFFIKPVGEYEFEAFYPTSSAPGRKKIQIIYDHSKKVWRHIDSPNEIPLDVHIENGKTFISLYGRDYPLVISPIGQYDIVVTAQDGSQRFHPVYLQPLTKTWHLRNINGHPVFTLAHQLIIRQIKTLPNKTLKYIEVNNLNPKIYGKATLFEVRNHHDEILNSQPLYLVAEINGDLVPVRKITREISGVHYHAYDIKNPDRPGHRLEWDGERWRIEPWTSPHISKELSIRITPNMYSKDVPQYMLPAADQQGIYWNAGKGYLKIRGKYIEIHKGTEIKIGPPDGKKILVYYKNQQFHPSTPLIHLSSARQQIINHFSATISEQLKHHGLPSTDFSSLLNQLKKSLIQTTLAIPEHNQAEPSFNLNQKLNVRVESVPSNELDRKRYLFTMGDEHFFLEISRDGKEVRVLQGEPDKKALFKYHKTLSGGDIKHVIALKRDNESKIVQTNSRSAINAIARGRIESGTALLNDALLEIQGRYDNERILLAAHSDFFRTSAFENNVFSSPENAYQAIIDVLVPLSKKFPDAIIIPGSIYISQDIPSVFRQNEIYYQEGKIKREIEHAINFSTIIAPVLHRGKIVTIARKGEYLSYINKELESEQKRVNIVSMDQAFSPSTTLIRSNIKSHPHMDSDNPVGAKTGTIYVGKTLMPNETAIAEWFFCPCKYSDGREGIEHFFSNEFMVGDNKFLLVLEEESEQFGEDRPIVRQLAYPQNEKDDEVNRYDWIIHSSAGNELDERMQYAGDNYLYADRYNNCGFTSLFKQRIMIITHSEERKISLFDFVSD